jgi:predicted CXXCH cytochrome family protein
MKTSISKLALGLTLVSMSGIAMAGISQTKHNLGGGTNGAGPNGPTSGWNYTTATTEICVFCHTPHGADSSAAVPLWNRTLSTATYNTYADLGTSTLDAESTTIGSVSLACLSCHDGTQAMDVMINTPGGGSDGQLGVGTGTGTNGWVEFQSMSEVSAEMIYLGTDLRNDHPVSIQYAGTVPGLYTALDGDFKDALSTVAAGSTVYYIDTDASGTKAKNDLPLYNRTSGSLINQPLVECATCHDPHTNNTTFLRNDAGNDGSATCLSCHTK